MSDIAITGFDYTTLPTEAAAIARNAANRIRGRIVGGYLATGHDLLEVKAQLGHGKFGAWLSAEFGMTIRTAGRYMAAARFATANSDIMSKLLPETIQALAAPSLDNDVRAACVDRARSGEAVLPKHVRAMAREARAIRKACNDSIRRRNKADRAAEKAIAERRLARAMRRDQQGERDKAELAALISDALGERRHEVLRLLLRLRGYDIGNVLEDALADVSQQDAASPMEMVAAGIRTEVLE